MEKDSICEIVRKMEQNYTQGTSRLNQYVDYSMYDTLEKIDAYLNSVHTSGKTDSLKREKPFFNIVSAACNIWYRATDIDRKDIRILPSSPNDLMLAYVAEVHLKNWMNEERFGVFLNEWGRSLARYGSSVVKFVEKEGRLIPSVVSWTRLIVDPIDFDASPVIEKIFLTPAQLKMRGYDEEQVEELIESATARRTLGNTEQKDNLDNFIEVYEIHGELPLALLKDDPEEEDWNVYRQQMHVVSFVKGDDGEYSDYTLYKGKEKESPYMITHLIKEDGRTLSIGAVEYLFDAQWMANHTAKQMKDYLDLASKMVFMTADTRFVGRNVLKAVETGDIMVHADGKPLSQINNSAMNVSAIMAYQNQWKNLGTEVSATPEAMRGITPPSGTPYSSVALVTQQANSLFEIMIENKGLALEDMLRLKVIPFLKRKMDTSEEIAATLDEQGVSKIDSLYVPREAIRRYNDQAIETILKGGIPDPFNPTQAQQDIQQELAPMGNQRFFKPSEISTKTWADLLDGFEWRARVETSGEEFDKQALLGTLSTIFQTIASNPMVLQDENARMVFGKILSIAGTVSPIELSTKAPMAQLAPPTATGQPIPSPLSPTPTGAGITA